MDKEKIKLEKFVKEKKYVEIDFMATCSGISLNEKGRIITLGDDYVILEDKEGRQNKIFIDYIIKIQEVKI